LTKLQSTADWNDNVHNAPKFTCVLRILKISCGHTPDLQQMGRERKGMGRGSGREDRRKRE